MVKIILKYALVFVLSITASFVRSQTFTTHLYTTADGLADNYIFYVYQDSYGYLWIGTINGLSRFDGKRFLNFGLRNGLPSLFVDRVYEDANHRLWIGTRRGMAELKGDSCYVYPLNDKSEISFVSGFFEPSPGRIWATTDQGIYELSKNQWIKISIYPGLENAGAGQITKTSDGLVFNYGGSRLIRQEKDGHFSTLFYMQLNRPYYNNLFQKNDTIYMSTYSGLRYLSNGQWVGRFSDTLSTRYTYTSYADRSGRFWFGTKQDGVLAIIPGPDKISYLRIPLSFNLVSNFFEDKDNNLWVAGFQGLLKIAATSYKEVMGPVPFKSLRNCIVTPANNMIVSGADGKISLLKIKNGGSTGYVTTFSLQHPEDFIDYFTFDDKVRLWFTTRRGELYSLNGLKLNRMTQIIRAQNDGLRDIAYDKARNKLIVCGDSVLLIGNENGLDTFFCKGDHAIIPLPWRIFFDPFSGSMLVQTIDDGLMFVTADGERKLLDKRLNFSIAVSKSDSVRKEVFIWAVYRGRSIKKYLWKGGGIPTELETILPEDGLPENFVLDLALDNDQRLWLATTRGVTMMQKAREGNWTHRNFELNESGSATPLSFSKLAIDDSNHIWMTTDTRLILFDPHETAIKSLQTTTVIEKILLFDQPADWSAMTDSVTNYNGIPVDPILNYNQNTLSIVFNGIQVSDPSLLEYSYRLSPVDTTWSNPSAGNIVSFFQLQPGHYRFEVRSRVKGFGWGAPTLFSFSIKIPFWERWWFRLAIILAASALIVLIFQYRMSQLKLKSGMENKLRELEMKALKAQMNPHFIHNALNSIQSLILNEQTSQASHYISKFAKLLRQVLENAEKNLISLDKELYSLRLYVDLEKLRMNMEIEYTEEIDENILTSEIRIPPLILQPFVENALWHGLGNKEGDKKITIHIYEQAGWIYCKITDNGIGRQKAAEAPPSFPEGHFSKAVNITRQRLEDFNQAPGVDPVTFVDLTDDGEVAGTMVIVCIKARYQD